MAVSATYYHRYKSVFDASLEAMLVMSSEGVVLDANPEACNILGCGREELLSTDLRVLFDPSDPGSKIVFEERGAGEKRRLEVRMLQCDRTPFAAEISLAECADENGDRLVGVVLRKQYGTGDVWDARARMMSTLVEKGQDLVILCDDEYFIRSISPSVERVLGYSSGEVVGKNALDYLHPEDCERLTTITAKASANRADDAPVEFRVWHADGSWRNLEGVVRDLLDDSRVGGTVINVRDVTELRQAEDALHQSKGRYRTVVEQAAENIFVVDPETGLIIEANAALHISLGYAEELRHMTLYDIVADDRSSVDQDIERVLEKGRCSLGERKYCRKDGSLVDFEVNAGAIRHGDREVLCVVAYDVTERKRTEENLRRSLGVLLALREAGQILGSTLESEEIVTRLLKIMRGVSGLTAAVISVEDERGETRIWRAVGLEGLWRRARYAPEADQARQVVLKAGAHQLFRLRRPDSETGHLVGLCLPLRMRNRVAGVLEAYGPESLAENDAIEILRSLAAQAASSLENATLYGTLAEREKRLAELVGQLFAAQEEERRRVAYEVHDGLAQIAAAAHQHLQAFARFHPPGSEEGRELLGQALKLVQSTVGEARQVIADLRPTALDDFGLQTAIRLETDELRTSGWRIHYAGNLSDDERLPVAVETALFRIAQEALTNVRRHAGIGRVRLSLGRLGKRIRLRVRDWGGGFDPEARSKGGPGERVGLSSMSERVALLGGEFRVHSRLGVGTLIVADVPLPEEPIMKTAISDTHVYVAPEAWESFWR